MRKFFFLTTLATSAIAEPRFDLKPKEGYVITVGCQNEFDEECSYDSFLLGDPRPNLTINFSKKNRSWPGLEKAPKFIIDSVSSAAEAMGDVTYVHVAVTYKSKTYEYTYDRATGWNSFRAVDIDRCTLKCMKKLPSSGDSGD